MRSLGVERAWVLSARDEDILAARTAGLTPIGVVPAEPRKEGVTARRRILEGAGAALIAAGPADLLEWLS
jgi:phosphoglycolate phosphatase-like HAD superfamily hydrolase